MYARVSIELNVQGHRIVFYSCISCGQILVNTINLVGILYYILIVLHQCGYHYIKAVIITSMRLSLHQCGNYYITVVIITSMWLSLHQ